MYGSNPARKAAGQLGLITAGLAYGVVSCHERGIAAMRAQREARAQDDAHDAIIRLQNANVELGELAKMALDEVARLTAANADLRQACEDRQRYIDRLRARSADNER